MKRIFKIVLAVVLVIIVASIIAGATAGHHDAENATTTTTTSIAAAASATTTTTPSTTTTVPTSTCPSGDQCTQGFEASNVQVQNSLGSIGGTIRITNTNTQTDGLNFTITFFANSNVNGTPIGSATGAALSIAPGQTVTETLISTDPEFSQSNFYWQFQVDDVVPGGA